MKLNSFAGFAIAVLCSACEATTALSPAAVAGPAPVRWGEALYARFGYTPEQVRAAIGEPTRRVVRGGKEIWIYERPADPARHVVAATGAATFQDGQVVGATISAHLSADSPQDSATFAVPDDR
jgi:hypothetical protein